MAERELGLPFDRGQPGRPNEIPAHELMEAVAHRPVVEPADRRQRSRPEHLAENRGVLKQGLALGAQRVQAGCDQRLKRLRNRDVVAGTFAQHLHELLGVERVAAGALEQALLRLGREHRPFEQSTDQPRRVVVRERRQRDRRRVSRAAAPRRVELEELGTRGAEDDERNGSRPRDQVLDELEQRRVCPVEVLDDEDEGSLRRNRFEKGTPGGERLVAVRCGFALGGSNEPRELAFDPRPLGGAREERLDGCRELVARRRRVVGLENAGVCLDDLAERPQRDAFPVRQAASLPPVDELRLRIDVLAQLGG